MYATKSDSGHFQTKYLFAHKNNYQKYCCNIKPKNAHDST